jgi:hypothetical protein
VNRRTIVWIILGAVALHVGAFLFFGRMNPLPKTRYEAPPNFGYKQTTYVDPATGEKTIEREIRVSTKLAKPGTYEAQPKRDGESAR